MSEAKYLDSITEDDYLVMRMEQPDDPAWLDNNGHWVLISEMADRHLLNTHRLIRRLVRDYSTLLADPVEALRQAGMNGAEMRGEAWPDLCDEIKRRRLLPLPLEGGVPDGQGNSWKTARKSYSCVSCGASIRPGNRYVRISRGWKVYDHVCVRCAVKGKKR